MPSPFGSLTNPTFDNVELVSDPGGIKNPDRASPLLGLRGFRDKYCCNSSSAGVKIFEAPYQHRKLLAVLVQHEGQLFSAHFDSVSNKPTCFSLKIVKLSCRISRV